MDSSSTKMSNATVNINNRNPWVFHLQKLGLELKCPLCLNLLKRPSLLPCNHIFCSSCLPKESEFGFGCPICNAEYFDKDIRHLPFIENLATIYLGLQAGAHLCQSGFSGTGRILDRCTSLVHTNHDAEKSKGVQMNSDMGNGLVKSSCSKPMDTAPREDNEISHVELNLNHMDYLSAGSPDDVKSSENDSNDQVRPTHQVSKSTKRTSSSRVRCNQYDGSTSGTEEGHSKGSKKHKKQNNCSDSILSTPVSSNPCVSQNENLNIAHSSLDTKTQPLAKRDGSMVVKAACGFCQSSTVSECSGSMLHYMKGKPVDGDESSLPGVIHVHSLCIEWAPQVYFVGEIVKNLEKELHRGSQLKCSKCKAKGAVLGCYHNSCQRTYHVTCAMEIASCRWDYDDFLMLCPSHSAVKFPKEKSNEKRKSKQPPEATEEGPKPSNFWTSSLNQTKGWVFCGSGLSSDQKHVLTKFASMIDVPLSKYWKPEVTHLIASTNQNGACTRTMKVLMATLHGRWVLTMDWVKACMESMHPVAEESYEVALDNHRCHGGPRTGRLHALDNAPKLFNGLSFFFSGDFPSSGKEDLQNLVMAGGGKILEDKEALAQKSLDKSDVTMSLVVYNIDSPPGCKLGDEVTIIWQRLNEAEDLAAKFGSQVIGHTWLFESIAAYKLQPFVR